MTGPLVLAVLWLAAGLLLVAAVADHSHDRLAALHAALSASRGRAWATAYLTTAALLSAIWWPRIVTSWVRAEQRHQAARATRALRRPEWAR